MQRLARHSSRKEAMMIEEFKKFALRGNAVDLAIGVIIGAAFGAIVNSLVGDVLTPIIGAITGGIDFSNHFIPLSSKMKADEPAAACAGGQAAGTEHAGAAAHGNPRHPEIRTGDQGLGVHAVRPRHVETRGWQRRRKAMSASSRTIAGRDSTTRSARRSRRASRSPERR